jgi:hypothetical protein
METTMHNQTKLLLLLHLCIFTFAQSGEVTNTQISSWQMTVIAELDTNSRTAIKPTQRSQDLQSWITFLGTKTYQLYPLIFTESDKATIEQLKTKASTDYQILINQLQKVKDFKEAANAALTTGTQALAALFTNASFNTSDMAPIIQAEVPELVTQLATKIAALITAQKESSLNQRAELLNMLNAADDNLYFSSDIRQKITTAQQDISAYQESCLYGNKLVTALKNIQSSGQSWGNQIDVIKTTLLNPAYASLQREFIMAYD